MKTSRLNTFHRKLEDEFDCGDIRADGTNPNEDILVEARVYSYS
jgi:hypothetical protein